MIDKISILSSICKKRGTKDFNNNPINQFTYKSQKWQYSYVDNNENSGIDTNGKQSTFENQNDLNYWNKRIKSNLEYEKKARKIINTFYREWR